MYNYNTLNHKKFLPPHTQGSEHGPCVEQIRKAHIKYNYNYKHATGHSPHSEELVPELL